MILFFFIFALPFSLCFDAVLFLSVPPAVGGKLQGCQPLYTEHACLSCTSTFKVMYLFLFIKAHDYIRFVYSKSAPVPCKTFQS